MVRRKLKPLALPFFCLILFASTWSGAQPLIDNEQVRIVPVVLRPHEPTSLDSTSSDSVLVYLNSGEETLDLGSGRKSLFNVKPGDVKWIPQTSPAAVQLTTNRLMNAVRVELKKGTWTRTHLGPINTLDSVIVDPAHYRLVFENDRARAVRAQFGPHELAPIHEHMLNRVVIYLTDQETRVVSADGTVKVSARKAGDVSWGTAAKHTEQNLRQTSFEAIVVELKH